MPAEKTAKTEKAESDVIGTLMMLTLSFTLAMAFRAFVCEGYVIPTGSMGPTLMGAHARLFSPLTAYEYPTDISPAIGMALNGEGRPLPVVDPMISTRDRIAEVPPQQLAAQDRAGDRVLVLKPLYAFARPKRWDVAVFKSPTAPVGASENFIKRMVGLPNETLLLFDGDVFTGPLGSAACDLKIERKPEHVQRAVWQRVHDSDYQPVVPVADMESAMRASWDGGPWRVERGDRAKWAMAPNRRWRYDGTGDAALSWDVQSWAIDDWNSYNALRMAYEAVRRSPRGFADPAVRHDMCFAVNDLRLCTAIECADMANFATTFRLSTRGSTFEFDVRSAAAGAGKATLRRVPEGGEAPTEASFAFTPRGDGLIALEFWHVDQRLWMFVDGRLLGTLDYEFATLDERLAASLVGRNVETYVKRPTETRAPTPPRLEWAFSSAAPFVLHRVRVDRDLYYRPVLHDANNQYDVNGPYLYGPGFACDWEHPAQLGATDYLMLGDNSAASRDARQWGRPHAITLRTVGDAQPGVVPESLIVGKAWCVYFPAPISMSPGGADFIPDFGRVRFIR